MSDDLDVRERLSALETKVDLLDKAVRDDLHEVDERATAAARFVRRVLYAAGGLILGSIVAAVGLIYAAGERAAEGRAEMRAVSQKIDELDRSLTDLRGQAKLLLEHQLRGPRP